MKKMFKSLILGSCFLSLLFLKCICSPTGPERGPEDVWLNVPYDVNKSSITLNWTESNANGGYYHLYRRNLETVDKSSDLIKEIWINTSSNSHTNTDLTPNTRYYYRIYVTDRIGKWSNGSNIIGVTTKYSSVKKLIMESSSTSISNTSTFDLTLRIENIDYVFSLSFDIINNTNLSVQQIDKGNFITTLFAADTTIETTTHVIVCDTFPNIGSSGSGTIATLKYKAVKSGTGTLRLTNIVGKYKYRGGFDKYVDFDSTAFDSVLNKVINVSIQ